MRLAIVSDIHANLTALEAVLRDLTSVGADLVVQGGDLVVGGTRPAEVIDVVRELKWPSVFGNAEEILWRPDRVEEKLAGPHFERMRTLLHSYTIPETRAAIGDERLAWLQSLPMRWTSEDVAVVHAAPDNVWDILGIDASDEALERTFGVLAARCVVYGHIHHPFVRRLPSRSVANSGSVSLAFDGDPRAAYLVIDGDRFEIRRVAYDIEAEVALLQRSRDPFAQSTAQTLRTGRYVPL